VQASIIKHIGVIANKLNEIAQESTAQAQADKVSENRAREQYNVIASDVASLQKKLRDVAIAIKSQYGS
jgi:hypothetical protein